MPLFDNLVEKFDSWSILSPYMTVIVIICCVVNLWYLSSNPVVSHIHTRRLTYPTNSAPALTIWLSLIKQNS